MDCAEALLMETSLTVGDAVVLFLSSAVTWGEMGGLKSVHSELGETWQRRAEESSGDRERPYSSRQHALSPFGFQSTMRNPLI